MTALLSCKRHIETNSSLLDTQPSMFFMPALQYGCNERFRKFYTLPICKCIRKG